MNKQRIEECIEMMRAAKNLNMVCWQKTGSAVDSVIVRDIPQLHTCGNKACFGGYLAISAPFQAAGGEVDGMGCPLLRHELGEFSGSHAVAEYLDISKDLASAIVHGAGYRNSDSFYEDLFDVSFEHVEPKHIIKVLEMTLRGELK